MEATDTGTAQKASPWNSLEKAKIVVSVAQTLATITVSVALGIATISMTKQSQRDAKNQQMQATVDASRREKEARTDADRRANEAREDATRRDAAARLDANQRSDLASREAATRLANDRFVADESAKFARVIAKRSEMWSRLAPELNEIYSYLLYVGKWKQFSASDLVKMKRDCDGIVFSDRLFLTDDFFNAYQGFMRASYRMGNGMGLDAQPRTTADARSEADIGSVTGEDNTTAVHEAYYRLQSVAARELNLRITAPRQPPPLRNGGSL